MSGPQPAAGAGPRDGHAWELRLSLADGYFALVVVATELFCCLSRDDGWTWTPSGVLILGLVPLYLVAGRPSLNKPQDSRLGMVFAVGAGVLFVPAAVMQQITTVVMYVLAPMMHLLLSQRRAITAILVTNLAPIAAWVVLAWDQPAGVAVASAISVAATVPSVAFGAWINRIVDQSRERADLIAQLDASREEVARLFRAHGALLERERLSREIHDTLAQGFTSLVMLCQAQEAELDRDGDPERVRHYLSLMQRTARENLAEARSLVSSLAPAQLDQGSLEDAVRRLGERLGEELGIRVDVEVHGTAVQLPPAVEVVALRSVQEALANVRKHARASRVAVVLRHASEALELTVSDDGCGFRPDAAAGAGYGLPGMRARVGEIGGTAEVSSEPGRGTEVTVRLAVGDAPGPAAEPQFDVSVPVQEAAR